MTNDKINTDEVYMTKIVNRLMFKQIYTIKDLALILNKKTQTIRKWENKGIISKCKNYSDNGWREYSRIEFANILEEIINYPWERNNLRHIGYIQYLINTLKMEV